MTRRHSPLLALACVAPLIHAPAAAQPTALQGDWLGVATTGISLGLMVPAYEHLAVHGDRAMQRAWAYPDTPGGGCTDTPADPPACAPPVVLGAAVLEAGRAKGGADGLTVRAEGPQASPFTHPTDAAIWPEMALAGHDWQLRGDDRRVILSREAMIEGVSVTLERRYYRMGPDTAGHLWSYIRGRDVSQGRTICEIDALHADPALWAVFEAEVATMAPVTAELHRLANLATRSRDQQLRYLTLLYGPEVVGDQAADVSDLPEAARVLWLAPRGPAETAPGGALLEGLGLSVPPDLARRAAACIEYSYGP
jgi:hypothetical protein